MDPKFAKPEKAEDPKAAARAVKETYRTDFLQSENMIFINKLNHICDNHDGVTIEVSPFSPF